MLKFVMSAGEGGRGGPVLGIGLSEGNLERLRAGESIRLDLSELGLELRRVDPPAKPAASDVVLFAGGSDQELAARLGVQVSPEFGPGHETRIRYVRPDEAPRPFKNEGQR